jgi:hypothetical protein
MDIIFPILFSLAAGIVAFGAATYVISHYRARFGAAEIRAALVIGIATLTIFSAISFGRYLFGVKTGEEVFGVLIVIIALVTVVAIFVILRRRESSL